MSEQTDEAGRDDGREGPLTDPVGEHLGVGADPEPDRDPAEPSDLARPRPEDDPGDEDGGPATR